jgi:SRSO17 transposase
VEFRTKPQIALAQIEAAVKAGVAIATRRRSSACFSEGPSERLPAEAWNDVEWREGSNEPLSLSSRFAAVRVLPASRDHKLIEPHPVKWLVVEWPEGETEPAKYWLSTLPENTPLAVLVDVIKLRWRIERDYEELKSELGLAHFEGRGWRGFPPSAPWRREKPALSGRSRSSRASDPSRTPCAQLDRDDAQATDDRPGKIPLSMPMLPSRLKAPKLQPTLVTLLLAHGVT